MRSPFMLAHERDCPCCLAGRRCEIALVLMQDAGSLFDAAGVPDPAEPVSDAPRRAVRRWRRTEVTS